MALVDASVNNVSIPPALFGQLDLSDELYQVIVSSNVMLVRLSHPSKALYPMVVTLAGIAILVRLLQSLNAHGSILIS